ncbi:MAG: site-specific DNA-methyltransferase [Thermoleophilia bacterium]|nr:site-specific DNA-methyltransferase [Thermoleophilia bacterium]
MDLSSQDIAEDKRQELLRLFPEVRTEGGKLDFERLKLALGEAVDTGRERYGMSWPGKADCFRTIQMPSLGTLRLAPEESVNFDTSENLIIEGDNLEVLKLLQKSYLGKVKMIYIDPPYNTGNDFIYPDNYSESLRTYLEYTGQVDAEGRKFGTNTDADGRFHSKWLNMMYPRLYLARNLLREDGVIFISIDDNEVHNLRALMNEVFGEENFVAAVIWQKRYSRENRGAIGDAHDYLLVYAAHVEAFQEQRALIPMSEDQARVYKNPNGDPKGRWRAVPMTAQGYRPNQMYEIETPTGIRHEPPEGRCWSLIEPEYLKLKAAGRIYFGKEGSSQPGIIRYLSEVEGLVPWTWWPAKEVGHTDEARKEIRAVFGSQTVYDTPKPSRLIKRILEIAAGNEGLVLDFFAGSGTTAQAVLDLNKQDNGNRKFILVQLPEPTGREDYPTIAEITKERVRRVIKKVNEEDATKLDLDGDNQQDRGFRVFKLDESNFKPWNADVSHDTEALKDQLDMHVEHVRDGRSQDDILYELLLKSGYPLTAPVETLTLAGKTVYSVAGGALFICLERELTLELIRAIAGLKPERVVCLDEGFAGNDQLKANAVQIFRTKGITSFKTV